MSRQKKLSLGNYPEGVQKILVNLGKNLKMSRKRRNLTMSALASSMFVTRQTVSRMESGDPTMSILVYLTAIFCLQREKELDDFLSPKNDVLGCMLDEIRQIQRKRVKPVEDDGLNF